MSDDDDLGKLLEPMSGRAVDLQGAAFRVDRARVVARMAKAGPRGARGRFTYVLAAATCVTVLGVGARLWHERRGDADGSLAVEVFEGDVAQVRDGARADVPRTGGARITSAGELETGRGARARVRAPDGLDVELAGDTRVGLDDLRAADSRLELLAGSIRCVVPRHSAAHPFRVHAADLTLVDEGTVFTVSLDGATRAARVSVEEGEILVRDRVGETRVRAGGVWSTPPIAVALPVPTPQAVAEFSPPLAPEPTRLPGRASDRATPRRATLALEAQLLREGLAAERQGRLTNAAVTLKALLARYPRSPLAPDARAALTRVEASSRR